jgi:predicted nucleotidyltransferase
MIERLDLLNQLADEHPRPLLFATVSGAHLYGFPSPDSDFDLRGVHLARMDQILGLSEFKETIERAGVRDGRDIDLVTHEVKKFFRLLLKKNGYVLEQLHSPLIVRTSTEHEELKRIAAGLVTRHHVHHYLGFARNQWDLFRKENPPRAKPLLYVYRVILTGIHLMRTGETEANLVRLNESCGLPYIAELIEAKTSGEEKTRLAAADLDFHEREVTRLMAALTEAGERSSLPEAPTTREQLNDLLLRIRRKESSSDEPRS